MQQDNASYINQDSVWELLLQFVAANGPAGERESVQRITETVQELGLPPPQVAQIGKSVMEALRKAPKSGHQDEYNQPTAVRIWISKCTIEGRSRSSAKGKESDRKARRGWGFFLIGKQDEDLQAAPGGTHYLVELFLYQQGEHAQRQKRS